MSYVVSIWEHPLGLAWPRSIDRVLAFLDRHADEPAPRDGKFVAFAKALTARYPCITDPVVNGKPVEELAWSDGPLDGDAGSAVYNIGIGAGPLRGEVSRFVLATARLHGLCYGDEQAGEYHYPNGWFLNIKDRVRPVRPNIENLPHATDVPAPGAMLALIAQRLAPLLARQGFAPAGTPTHADDGSAELSVRATSPFAWHELDFGAYRNGTFRMHVRCCYTPEFKLRRRIWEASGEQDLPETASTVLFEPQRWMTDAQGLMATDLSLYVVRSSADLDAAIAHLASQIETRLFPLLRCFRHINALDAAFNLPDIRDSVFFGHRYNVSTHHLRVAWLARNPRLESMCEEFLQGIVKDGRSYFAGDDEEVRNVVEFLRANPRRS